MTAAEKRKELQKLLRSDDVIMAPSAYDALSAKCIEKAGFSLCSTTGYGMHGAQLGCPDNGLLAFNEMEDALGNMADAIDIPLIADAEGGYGHAVNTWRTVRTFEKAGVAGLFIEDQKLPPNCPLLKENDMISTEEMIGKIHAALDARTDDNFIIIARTEARGDEAIRRCNLYLEAGADMVKPLPMSREDMIRFPQEISGLLHVGFAPGKPFSAGLTAEDAGALGYKIVTYPMTALFAAVKAMQDAMLHLKKYGCDDGLLDNFITMEEYFRLVDADKFRFMDQKYLPSRASGCENTL